MSEIKILVVEDETIVAKDICMRLKNLGYHPCGIASSGQQAIDKSIFHQPDLVLMDIMLKGDMNGIQASEKIKDILDIPVIFVTAYADSLTLEQAKITEPFGYILKPFDDRELNINIEIALYKQKTERRLKQSEERLYKTLVNIGDGIIVTNVNEQVTFMNPFAEQLSAYSLQESKGKRIHDLVTFYKEENSEKISDYLQISMNNQEVINYESCLFANDRINREIIVNIRIAPIRDYHNNISGAVIIISDITAKTQGKNITNLITESISSAVGTEFFRILVKQLAKTLKVKYAFISENINTIDKKVKILSSWELGSYGETRELILLNKPGAKVIDGEYVSISHNLVKDYPEDEFLKINNIQTYIGIPLFDSSKNIIGQLGVMNDKSIKESSFHQSILKFVCERAANEIQRKRNEEALLKSEQKYKDLTNSLPHTIFETDKNGKITYFNTYGIDTFCQDNNLDYNNFNIYDFVLEKDKLKENISKIFAGEYLGFSEYTAIKNDKEEIPVLINYNPIMSDNNLINSFRGVIIDISQLRHVERALQESEEKYSVTLKGTGDGFWNWDIKKDKFYFSPRWKDMLGYNETEISDNIEEWFKLIHPQHIDSVKEKISAFFKESANQFEVEYQILDKNKKYLWMFSKGNALKDNTSQIYRVVGYQRDIDQHKQNEKLLKELLHNASHDSLTGLPNRSLFLEKLEKSINNIKRKTDNNFAVLFVDIDKFKIINESLGHSTGNLLLTQAAIKLQLCLRPEDTIARLGSDEFIILLEDIRDKNDAIKVANRIQKDLSYPFILNNHEIFASASIGIAMSNKLYEQPEELIRDADIAMRKAKMFGRARYELFDAGMKSQAAQQLQLEADLRYAIERQEFMLYYQPIISLKTGDITGFEALIRWLHPKKGIVGSDIFIPIAEETGMIIPIGNWVLKEACNQIKIWQKKYHREKPLTMSVNISGRQFSHPKLIENITNIVNDSEIDPVNLKLEITESTIMDNAETATIMLEEIRKLNIQLQIDDFGTGYSSLSYLHRFPVNTLKVDRSFVSRIGSNNENVEIVKTIVSLAKNLNMVSIAEGIETKDQLDKLRTLDCEYAQGYFFSRPVDVYSIEKLMDSSPNW